MYEKLPNLVIGFHGCSKNAYENVIFNNQPLKASDNSYDWLGHGIYFWEHNLKRAKEWAVRRYGKNAAVIGAVIDLGNCLNLTDSASSEYLKGGYKLLKTRCELTGEPLPTNRKSEKTKDILLRDLDCAVILQIQEFYSTGENKPAFDSVRGVFIEGDAPYPGSAFFEKTHVQLCICNPNCIKGYFAPRNEDKHFNMP
ncbi:MAG: hypothetical protein IJ857_00535 [Lachnospiraceae bacterium]|nr:hypothetical protein [Lachnospiraceae bacterium]